MSDTLGVPQLSCQGHSQQPSPQFLSVACPSKCHPTGHPIEHPLLTVGVLSGRVYQDLSIDKDKFTCSEVGENSIRNIATPRRHPE